MLPLVLNFLEIVPVWLCTQELHNPHSSTHNASVLNSRSHTVEPSLLGSPCPLDPRQFEDGFLR